MKNTPNTQPIRFTTQFHTSVKKMEQILAKHWPILLEDLYQKSAIPPRPKVSNRKAKNVKNSVAPSKLKPVLTSGSHTLCLLPLIGMFQSQKALCLTCKHVTHGQTISLLRAKPTLSNNITTAPVNLSSTASHVSVVSFMLEEPLEHRGRGLESTATLRRKAMTNTALHVISSSTTENPL